MKVLSFPLNSVAEDINNKHVVDLYETDYHG